MLALERKATLDETAQGRWLRSMRSPLAAPIRIRDVKALQDLIGAFHFDSERSRSEGDFRLFIRPSSWPALREVCIEHLGRDHDPLLDSDPGRELVEEFFDALGIELLPGQYQPSQRHGGGRPAKHATGNPRARGYPTARIYRMFEARITTRQLAQALLDNSEGSRTRRCVSGR
jgi:hypothetical protein